MSSRPVYRIRRRPPPPGAAQSPLHSGVHAPHLARARPDRGPSGHRGRGPTTTTHPPPTTQTRAPLGAGRRAERARQNQTPGPRTQKQTGTPAGRQIKITGWAATQRQRRGERHRPAPRKREGPKTSPHHSGLGKRDAPATGRPARKGPDRPTTPPRAVLGGGAEDTEPAKGTRLAPSPPGATPRPGRKEQPEEGKIPSARGGADRARATSPRNNRVGAPVFSRPPHWAARIAAPNGGRHHFRSV